jgi:RNA recognition motif-containing protein
MTDNVQVEADPCRVFIGNLNYQTKESELTEFCATNVGKV